MLEFDLLLVDFHGVLVPKWRLTDDEFVYEDSKRPPIYRVAMAFEHILVQTLAFFLIDTTHPYFVWSPEQDTPCGEVSTSW